MPDLSHRNVANSLALLAMVLSCAHVGLYVYVALETVAYPYQLEWMEGGTVDVIHRILSGKDLYTEPSLEYVPYIYTPLYYFVSSLVTSLLGEGLTAPRVVSLAATVGNAGLIYGLVRREGGSRVLSVVAIGFFAGCFALSGRWYHIARVDSLYLFFVLLGAFTLRSSRGLSAAGAGIVWGMAFLTKQSALMVAAPVVAVMFFIDRKRALIFATLLAAVAGGSSLWLHAASDGWFSYFVFELPGTHRVVYSQAVEFWTLDLLGAAWIALFVSLLGLVLLVRKDRRVGLFYVALAVGMIGSSYASRLHSGGYLNVVMPAYAMLSILMPLGISLAREKCASWGFSRERESLVQVGFMLAVSCQLVMIFVDPRYSIPEQRDYQAGKRFLEFVAEIEGDVLLFDHRFIQTRAGKRSYGLGGAGRDVLRSRGEVRDAFYEELQRSIRSRRFHAVILNHRDEPHLQPALSMTYDYLGEIFNDDSYYPVTGSWTRPNYVFSRKPVADSGS